jgi:hypothetical protein
MWGSSDRNRGVWGILALVACLMIPFNLIFLDKFESPVVHMVFCCVDLVTIGLLIRVGIGSMKLVSWQAGCLLAAIAVNYMVYIDATQGTYLVYEWYELAILSIAAAQLIPGLNGVARKIGALAGGLFRPRGVLADSYSRNSGVLESKEASQK